MANASVRLEEVEIPAARRKLSTYGLNKLELIGTAMPHSEFQQFLSEGDLVPD
jgi:hypothetical protein